MSKSSTVKPFLTVLSSPFMLGLLGGTGAFLFCATLLFSLGLTHQHIGTLDREKLIQEMATEVAGSGSLSEEELTRKLQGYKQFFDQAVLKLTATNKLILLNRSEVVSSNIPDYTGKIKLLISELANLEDRNGIPLSSTPKAGGDSR